MYILLTYHLIILNVKPVVSCYVHSYNTPYVSLSKTIVNDRVKFVLYAWIKVYD